MPWYAVQYAYNCTEADNKKMDADLIELLTQNLSRFDEGSDADRAGVYYVLGELSFPSPTKVTTILM